VLRKKSVANGYAAQVQAENLRAGRTQGVDNLNASATQIDVEAGASGAG